MAWFLTGTDDANPEGPNLMSRVHIPRPQARPLRRLVTTLLWTAVLGASPAALSEVDVRCGLKVAAALTAEPNPDLAAADLRALVDEQLQSPHFALLFASFVNTRFNRGLSMRAEEDAVFYVVRHVLENQLPWSQVYLGEYGWTGPQGYPEIVADPNGVGYFTAPGWVRRYAGNDLDGYMLFAAYRVVQNTTGIVLVPSPFNADQSSDFEGRQRPECSSCHLESPVALDKIARFFPRRTGFGNQMTLTPPENGPQELLNGQTFNDLKQLVAGLLETDDYRFWTCRLVFEYLYNRPESACEALVFDQCVAALEETDDIRDAIVAVATDPSFCATLEVP